MDSRKTEGPITILLSFEGGDAKNDVIGRKAQRPRRDIELDKVSQVPRGSVSENLIAERQDILYLILCSVGSQCTCLRRALACSPPRDLRMSLAAAFCTC